jgi:archaellum component FlaC
MTEVTNELMFELLKQIQARLDAIEHGIREVKQELNSVRVHILGMQNDIHNIYGILGRHDERLDRIERRLELRELAEAQTPFDPNL